MRAGLALACAALSAACVSTEHQSRDWSTYAGPGAAFFQAEEIEFPHVDDPLEPTNRAVAALNYGLLRYALAPVARVYRCVLPEVARERLEKAGKNLAFPTRLVNNLLQGKVRRSGVEVARFAINTTVGGLGLFDPAQEWGLHPYPEDFGQTLATWGWRPSTYLVLPLLGPRTVRDALGEIPDAATDPATYFPPAAQVRAFNRIANGAEATLRVIESTYDPYEAARTLTTLVREVDVEDFVWRQERSGPTQTLGAIFLTPESERFADLGRTHHVRIDDARPALPYTLWLHDFPAPLMYVLPGFGGHRLSGGTLAIAEIAYARGHSVVAISSATNFEFMRHGASVTVPGYAPTDARDVHAALTAIDRDLAAQHGDLLLERRICGTSLGGHHALRIAAETGSMLQPDLVLALNPPVDLENALLQLDRCYNAPLAFPPDERERRIEEIFGKVLHLSNGDLQPGMPLLFTELEARFLIGLAFRLDLQFLILQSQDLHDSGVLLTPRSGWHRAPAFREASEYSYMEYVYAFVLPYYAQLLPDVELDEQGARTLFERCDLRGIGDALRADGRVRVFTNANDFLLGDGDLDWLRATLGDRVKVFDAGGHLGNLYRDDLKSVIGATMSEAGEAP